MLSLSKYEDRSVKIQEWQPVAGDYPLPLPGPGLGV